VSRRRQQPRQPNSTVSPASPGHAIDQYSLLFNINMFRHSLRALRFHKLVERGSVHPPLSSAQQCRCLSSADHSAAPPPAPPLEHKDWPANEPILDYLADKNSAHRLELLRSLDETAANVNDVPIIIDGREHRTEQVRHQSIPFEHNKHVAQFYYATADLIKLAIDVASSRRRDWEHVPMKKRAKIFERAADLVSGKYRAKLNAATMLGQAKTIKQAEIDSAAELADFFRFNSHYARMLARDDWQPRSTKHERNSLEMRGLDGFVAAIAPFNFTAIGGNLMNAPVLMGNSVVYKPSDTAVLSNYLIVKLLQEAGLPDGLVNFVPCEGLDFGRLVSADRRLAGVNFTGSLATFQWLWTEVGLNVQRYDMFPRLVGECGGKNFHLVHQSAHVDTAVAQTIRAAFEYSGQKCSACSRLYVPASLWDATMRDKLVDRIRNEIQLGPATELDTTYTSAVIDARAFARIKSYLNYARNSPDNNRIITGGETNDDIGYYVQPTLIETKQPRDRLMTEEIFGPVLTVYVYQDNELDSTLELIDENPFALTGAVFAQDEAFIERARRKLRMSAGNFYINDKSTGAVVGQQPFGGSRHSGTNDKAGGPFNLIRWTNQLTVKRTHKHLVDI
jgi:1-pyrroline-5-carboxylate dehydrogenase